jgi:hypothetical protein
MPGGAQMPGGSMARTSMPNGSMPNAAMPNGAMPNGVAGSAAGPSPYGVPGAGVAASNNGYSTGVYNTAPGRSVNGGLASSPNGLMPPAGPAAMPSGNPYGNTNPNGASTVSFNSNPSPTGYSAGGYPSTPGMNPGAMQAPNGSPAAPYGSANPTYGSANPTYGGAPMPPAMNAKPYGAPAGLPPAGLPPAGLSPAGFPPANMPSMGLPPNGAAPNFGQAPNMVQPASNPSWGTQQLPAAQTLPPAYGGPSTQPVGTPSVPPASSGGVYRPGSVGRSTNYDFSGSSATR